MVPSPNQPFRRPDFAARDEELRATLDQLVEQSHRIQESSERIKERLHELVEKAKHKDES